MMRGGSNHNSEIEFHRKFLKKGNLVFDVGANRGQSSEIFLAIGMEVVAFEPQADLHNEIRQVCRNSPNLTIECLGLGAKEERLNFFVADYDQVASLRADWEGQRIGELSIDVSTLDMCIKKYGLPYFCKVDVEGWENEVFKGLSQSIPIISFEYHTSDKEIGEAIKVLERLQILAPYFCNIKRANAQEFSMVVSKPISEFIDFYPGLVKEFPEGYGDIFCALDPTLINIHQ